MRYTDLFKILEETTELMNKYMKECIDKDHKIAVLERALKIALEMTSCEYCPKDIAEKCDSWLGLGDGENCTETLKKYCIDQAEKELEEK